MASTYSTSLKLTLIGDGDQSGIWGQTTNSNLGTLLEQAVTGTVGITMADANYTLTSFNGVSDESRNAVIIVGGSNNAIRDVIPPVVEKMYTIVNNTAGGYAIRVIGTTGTGVNIPNGATALVYCNGTNFFSGLSGTSGNFLVSGNTTTTGTASIGTNATVGGTLGVTGVATFTASPIAPTLAYPDNSTKIATTAYVNTAISSSAITPIPAGSVFLIYQASAPTGWTQVTTAGLNDSALRIVTSTGGTTGGTTAFSTVFTNQTVSVTTTGTSGATTLSTAQIPSHTHTTPVGTYSPASPLGAMNVCFNTAGTESGAAGGGGSHTHSISASGTSSAVTLNVKYVNIILCSKN